jgi:histidine triad (HIT) family protein
MANRDWYCEDVLSGKLEVKKVWEDERVLAFHHPQPQAEIHVVVIPKQHVPSILDPLALDGALLSSMVRAVQESAMKLGLDKAGFYMRTNAAAPGVTPHMHWHIKGPGIP